MASCVMKQLREKHISAEISKCVWSPKMDLLAIANVQGQVCLHRLSWQQVWSLNPPTENQKVSALAWRPDSNVLAIGYTSGKLLLINIEDGSTIHELDLKEEVSSLSWNRFSSLEEDSARQDKQEDAWTQFTYPLPPLSKFGETGARSQNDVWQEPRLLQDQVDLNVLSIGTVGCVLHLYAYGLFHIASVNLKETFADGKQILSITPSPTLDFLSVIFERDDECEKTVSQVTVNSSLISSRHKELRSLAQKYGQIYSLMTYIGSTLTLVEEAWETTLIEMDSKLAAYAATVPEEGTSADFLELLTFGHCSPEFEIFLTNKFTEKNLKKLRHTVDMCYSTMQRLVVKHLQQVGMTLVLLLSQVEGMSQRASEYGALGVQSTEVKKAMGCVGSFLLKTSEFLQAIESSMRDFQLFVRWFSGAHLRLLREHVPAELSRMSSQEIRSLMYFLNSDFEEVVTGPDGEKKSHFRLEKANQYLKKEELKFLPHSPPTPFAELVKSNPALAAHSLIFIHNPKTSLLQEHKLLTEALTQMGAQPGISISSSMELGLAVLISAIEPGTSVAVSQIASEEGSVIGAIVPSVKRESILLLEWQTHLSNQIRVGSFIVKGSESVQSQYGMLDAQFYSPEILSLLLLDQNCPRNPSFAQIVIRNLRSELQSIIPTEGSRISDMDLNRLDLSSMPDTIAIRRLETGLAATIAVSGPRKVAAVIGENRRRIRIYEMEVEDDEDEDEEDTKNESTIHTAGTSEQMSDDTM